VKESELDWRICSRARLSRDPRFDGKFFIGVRGSGVYCRSICPAPTAKEKNCRYFATAAAAAEAGYRPCLRCRPESSPGTPAWLGTSTTVSRALRLIGESDPEDIGMEQLAERLGVGTRHLRRLFLRHLGATPNAVIQTRRVHFAKKLIDETNLPMTDLAIAAGYGSVRRFNAAIRTTYHRTPTQIRAIARQKTALPENHYMFRLRYRPPYDWKGMLSRLAASAVPGVEGVDEIAYRRTISLNGSDGSLEVTRDSAQPALCARIRFGDPRALFVVVERIRALFDLNADWLAIEKILSGDSLLAAGLKSAPGRRVPGCWNGFELGVRAVLARHTGGNAAKIAGRMAMSFGRPLLAGRGLTHLFPEPAALAEADVTSAGAPLVAAQGIRTLARAVCDGSIRFEAVAETRAFLEALCDVTRIDEWTAQYIAMHALGEPDAFSSEDNTLVQRSEAWRPWRAYAAMYLSEDFVTSRRESL
jgi:AraC family transcriptional regulator of adaptative response / DNA-3-methyladenine glycosylase II